MNFILFLHKKNREDIISYYAFALFSGHLNRSHNYYLYTSIRIISPPHHSKSIPLCCLRYISEVNRIISILSSHTFPESGTRKGTARGFFFKNNNIILSPRDNRFSFLILPSSLQLCFTRCVNLTLFVIPPLFNYFRYQWHSCLLSIVIHALFPFASTPLSR